MMIEDGCIVPSFPNYMYCERMRGSSGVMRQSRLLWSLVVVLVLAAVIDYAQALSMSSASPSLAGKKVLIVQNKGGGHGSLGYYLSKHIKETSPSTEVTILQDKASYKKVPFNLYDQIKAQGVSVIDCSLAEPPAQSLLPAGAKFDYVVDNWSKGATNATFVADMGKASGASQVIFVSSAGMYKVSELPSSVKAF